MNDYLFIVIKPGDHLEEDLADLIAQHENAGWVRISDSEITGSLDGINFSRPRLYRSPETPDCEDSEQDSLDAKAPTTPESGGGR